jgi:hypothetical protein
MARRGKVTSAEEALKLDRRALAMKILDTFIKYPLPPLDKAPLIPYNYCALPRLLQGTLKAAATALLSPICAPPS